MDSKALINMRFEIYGKTFEREFYINYFPDDDGMDERIKEWFGECYKEAYTSYRAEFGKQITKVIVIDNCGDCPYKLEDKDYNGNPVYYCNKLSTKDRLFATHGQIPESCPLTDSGTITDSK